jgi:hypothetical protein
LRGDGVRVAVELATLSRTVDDDDDAAAAAAAAAAAGRNPS